MDTSIEVEPPSDLTPEYGAVFTVKPLTRRGLQFCAEHVDIYLLHGPSEPGEKLLARSLDRRVIKALLDNATGLEIQL